MRAIIVSLAIIFAVGPAYASGPSERMVCLSSDEVRKLVATDKAVSSARAVRAARAVAPNTELLRTRLCREGDRLKYIVTFLRRDGRILPVTVDPASGKVLPGR